MNKPKVPKYRKTTLTQQVRRLEEKNMYLEAQLAGMEKLPVIDKEVFTRLLEVVYAAKGGLSSWARRS